MRPLIPIVLFVLLLPPPTANCQSTNNNSGEKFGNTLNLGVGLNYAGYRGRSVAAIMINYEFDVAKNFTLAPFIGYYGYSDYYYWGNKNYPYKNYYYKETSIPIGIKGTYNFDNLVKANSQWDFYIAGSLGPVVRTVSWEDGYYGEKYGYYDNLRGFTGSTPLYANLHIGTEVHLSKKLDCF